MLDKYLITIDEEFGDDLGIKKISFVNEPAIQIKGMAFNVNEPKTKLKFSSDDKKMRIVAPAIIPMDIYRYSTEEDYEYEVRFTIDVVEKIRNKFMANLSSDNNVFNIEHTDELVPAFVLESWIVGKEPKADKAFSEFGIEVPTGTLMIMSQVTDKDYYNKIVEEGLYAFSIEGFFGLDELKLMINKKEEINMEENNAIPNGEFEINGVTYVITDGKISVKEAVETVDDTVEVVAEDNSKPEEEVEETDLEEVSKEEEVVEETVKSEEELEETEAVVEEETVTEDKPSINEGELMAILEPKFEEIYNLIADLNSKIDDEAVVEEKTEAVEMSIDQRFSDMRNFITKNKK